MTDLTLDDNGVKLAVSVRGPMDAEPILFLHGLSLSRDSWEEIGDRLKHRYRVWTVDFRGHGHSDHAPRYELADYVSDAETVLAAIARPAVIVGHSLGGCVAGVLAQSGHPSVRAVFLEDPPWYLGQPGEWDKSIFPKLFSIVSTRQAVWRQQRASLGAYLDFLSNSPTPMGGIGHDHFGPRHLLSHASALQRQDERCWANGHIATTVLAAISTGRKFACPAKVVQADPRCGAALLEGDEARLAQVNPHAEIVRYGGCGHTPHGALAFEQRFIEDLHAFLSGLQSR